MAAEDNYTALTPKQTSVSWPSSVTFPSYPNTYYYSYPAPTPTVSRFRGTVRDLNDLPKPDGARVGDAYYVEKQKALVVRVTNGWHHFDS